MLKTNTITAKPGLSNGDHDYLTRPILCVMDANERWRFGIDKYLEGGEWDFINVNSDITTQQWREILRKHDPYVILGAWSMPKLDEAALREAKSLRYVCYLCGSVRKRVAREFLERGGVITNWGSSASRVVAECALTLMLASLRQLTRYCLEAHVDQVWQSPGDPAPLSLFHRRIGIHGFGHVAQELVKLLKPFNCSIIAYSKPVPRRVFDSHGIVLADSLDDLFLKSDIVVEAEALNPDTRHSITEQMLRLLGPGGVFVNVARGSLVAPGAIERVAAEGEVQFGLDVFAPEPMPEDCALRRMRNVTLTPHIAGPTRDRYEDCTQVAVENLKYFYSGRELRNKLSLVQYDIAT